jgi:hypothetical protein
MNPKELLFQDALDSEREGLLIFYSPGLVGLVGSPERNGFVTDLPGNMCYVESEGRKGAG